MRELTGHKFPGVPDTLTIEAIDEPGPGGACHEYAISWDSGNDPAEPDYQVIKFQDGPIKNVGPNGVTEIALLAVIKDRLETLQAGDDAIPENRFALGNIQNAIAWLQRRTLHRIRRGVEGTNQP